MVLPWCSPRCRVSPPPSQASCSLVGVGSIGDCDSIATTAAIDDDLWGYATYLVLMVAGIASQLTAAATIRGALRAAWSKPGGRQMRSV